MEFLSTDKQECHPKDYLLSETNEDFTEELRLLMEAHDALSFDSLYVANSSPADSGVLSPTGSNGLEDELSVYGIKLSPSVTTTFEPPVTNIIVPPPPTVTNIVPAPPAVTNVPSPVPVMATEPSKQCTNGNSRCKTNNEPKMDRNTKNALAAKLNRQKKKEYMNNLESKLANVMSENEQLKAQESKMKDIITKLQLETKYLKGVLVNQSTLSTLLQSIPQIDNVKLSSSLVSGKTRRSYYDEDDDKDLCRSSKRPKMADDIAGVCLHVLDNTASLEFCSECSQRHSTTLTV